MKLLAVIVTAALCCSGMTAVWFWLKDKIVKPCPPGLDEFDNKKGTP